MEREILSLPHGLKRLTPAFKRKLEASNDVTVGIAARAAATSVCSEPDLDGVNLLDVMVLIALTGL